MDAKKIIEVLEAEVLKRPTDFKLKERLANLLLFKGEIERAREVYIQVLELNPDSVEGQWGLARISWYQRIYEDTYFYLSRLSKKTDYQLTKEQALIYSKVLALKLNYKESSKWLDFAISQDTALLRDELPLLRKIRQKLIAEESFEERSNHKKNSQNPNPGSKNSFFPPTGNNSNNGGIPFFFPIGLGQGSANSNDKNQKQFIILELFGGGTNDSSSSSFQNVNGDSPEREYLSQSELENIPELDTFEQIAGLKEVKQKLVQELILPIKNLQVASAYARSTNPKVLLYGPPGCGKTSLARALANETGVTVFRIEASDFLDLSFEDSEAKLAYLIQQARLNKPSVLLFDEISWLAGISDRSNLVENAESRIYKTNLLTVLFELLSEKTPANKQIGLLATTSKPWLLDPYGFPLSKINSSIFVPPPSQEEKVEIFKSVLVLLAKKTPVVRISKINPSKLVEKFGEYFSTGEEIKEFINYCLGQMMLGMLSEIQLEEHRSNEQEEKSEEQNYSSYSSELEEKELKKENKKDGLLSTKKIEAFFEQMEQKESSNLSFWEGEFRRLSIREHPYHSLWKIAKMTFEGQKGEKKRDPKQKNTLTSSVNKVYKFVEKLFGVNKTQLKVESVLKISAKKKNSAQKSSKKKEEKRRKEKK